MHEVIEDEQTDPTEAVFCLLSLSTVSGLLSISLSAQHERSLDRAL